MKHRRFARLAKLRDTLHRQSLQALGAAQSRIKASEQALAELEDRVKKLQGKPVMAADLQLHEGMAQIARNQLEHFRRQREELAQDERQKATEQKQMQRLADKEKKRRRIQSGKFEQRTTEDWVHRKWRGPR